MAIGGGANLPVQAQAAVNNPAATGLDRASMMGAKAMPAASTPMVAPAPAQSFNPMAAPARPLGVGMRTAAMKKGGSVSSASKRADGVAQRGKTKGRMV